jgi:thiamine biosynthesis lipoprotein
MTAHSLARDTEGAFDATAGPYVKLWREARSAGRRPDEAALRAARSAVGWSKMHIDPESRTVALLAPGMSLDLGGIAKGYAVDRAVRRLRELGFNQSLVALAGDIAVGDPPPRTDGWRIAIASRTTIKPDSHVLLLSNACVSTSGDAEQFIEIAGVRHSHVIDPRTGLGITNGTTATVVADRGEVADGLASTMCILDSIEAVTFLEHHPDSAAIIEYDTATGIRHVMIDNTRRLRWSAAGVLVRTPR